MNIVQIKTNDSAYDKVIKHQKEPIRYISQKRFKSLECDEKNIQGFFRFRKSRAENTIQTEKNSFDLFKERPLFTAVRGYVKGNDSNFYGIIRPSFLPFILLIALLFCIFAMFHPNEPTVDDEPWNPVIEQFVDIEETIEEAEKIIKIQIETDANQETKQALENMKASQLCLEQYKVKTQDQIKVLNDKKAQIMEDITKVSDRKYFQEAQLDKVDTDIEQMQERIYEEYELTYSTCQEFKRPDFDIEIAMPEINNLKKEIAKLGYVNVNAIEDVKVLLERYNDLKVQSDDLMKAQADLEQIIAELSEEMITKFKNEFDKVNANFKITFRELFGGGNARLELTDPDNLLESGVDIVAEPPGKKLQNITLLSGGEKALTAIAILFAILKLKPMPFCLLDEIEAALDDSNVGRFAEYLRRFSSVTQFIVITHRKPTMELADSLYGVTMQEKGVSRMVSVKLSEAIKNVEVK